MSYLQHVRSPAEVAYERIKHAILNLTYLPGEKLSEVRLAADLELGRSPIRSALARLESENWIRVLEADELEQLSELRLLLECHATRSATANISDTQLADLRTTFNALKAKRIEDHIREFTALDTGFHSTIYRVAGNRRIEEILLNLKDQIVWVRAVTATLPGRVSQSLLEMDEVLQAMERRDADAAEQAMARHIGNIAATFKSMPGDHP
jgi:DNA-binding GntR family transcriptional regulator